MKKLLLLMMLFFVGAVPVVAQELMSKSDVEYIYESTKDVVDYIEVDSDTGLLLVDMSISDIMGAAKGLGFFSYDIHDFFTSQDDMPYAPYGIVFRGFDDMGGHDSAVAVYYFEAENANRDWSELIFDVTEMHRFADYVSAVTPYSQHIPNYETQWADEEDPIYNAIMRMTMIQRDYDN